MAILEYNLKSPGSVPTLPKISSISDSTSVYLSSFKDSDFALPKYITLPSLPSFILVYLKQTSATAASSSSESFIPFDSTSFCNSETKIVSSFLITFNNSCLTISKASSDTL